MVRREKNVVSKDQVRTWVAGCFHDLRRETEGWTPSSAEPHFECLEQILMSEQAVVRFKDERAARDYGYPTKMLADKMASSRGFAFNDLPPESQNELLDGVARALIENEALRQFWLNDRSAKVAPRPLETSVAAITFSGAAAQPPATEHLGDTVGQAIQAYLRQKTSEWTAKTLANRVVKLKYFEQHVGSDRPLSSITPHDIRAFRDAVLRLRKNTGRVTKRSFAQKQTDVVARRILPSTAELILIPIKAFFRWATENEGYLETNPAQNVKISVPKNVGQKRPRRPFDAEALTTLFKSPVFTGCVSAARRFLPGNQVVKDARYWIPILGYYTGARLGELVQLHQADVYLSGDIPYLEITIEGSDEAAGAAKHVKSEAAQRSIPLHPDVLALGFGDFVAWRAKYKKGSKRLFPEVKFGADTQASTTFSKWFGRLMEQVKLPDPALVFHSFRHTAEDAFRNAGKQQYVIDRIIGHSDGATSADYGDGIDLETAYEAICSMKLKVRLTDILPA